MANLPFEDERNYRPDDPEVKEVMDDSERQAQMRHRGTAPAYYRLGRKIIYRGVDLNTWFQAARIEPQAA